MEHHKNKQYTQCNDQHYPNPDKKGDIDSKGKESKFPKAKIKEKKEIPNLIPLSSLKVIQEENKTMWLDEISDWTTWQNEKKGY